MRTFDERISIIKKQFINKKKQFINIEYMSRVTTNPVFGGVRHKLGCPDTKDRYRLEKEKKYTFYVAQGR